MTIKQLGDCSSYLYFTWCHTFSFCDYRFNLFERDPVIVFFLPPFGLLFNHFNLFFKISPFLKPSPNFYISAIVEERGNELFDMFRGEEVLTRQKRERN